MAERKLPTRNTKVSLRDTHDVPSAAMPHLRAALAAIARGAWEEAERAATLSLVFAAQHPEPHRLLGLVLRERGRLADSVTSYREALSLRTHDALLAVDLADAQAQAGYIADSIVTLRDLLKHSDDIDHWFRLASMLDRHGELEEALPIFERIVARDPRHAGARLQLARCLFYCGHSDEAAAQFRQLIQDKQHVASAWYGLAEMKTVQLRSDELPALKRLCAKPPFAGLELATALHALGFALENAKEFGAAFDAFTKAANIERARYGWDREKFERHVSALRETFPNPLETVDSFGSEVIFIVGLPRSGSTLVEQILAAHPEVEGASELPDLQFVIEEESSRLRQPLSHWSRSATANDWRRLGENYLKRTQRWRIDKPRFTDKFPGNWPLAEIALAMLPGARVIDCRRDPLETAWSCFKQFFAPGSAPWSSDFDDLAAFWRLCHRHCDFLVARYPQRACALHYERLIEDSERSVHKLLAFCDLQFNAACLRGDYSTLRAIRTASAAQVRQPMRKQESPIAGYGALLDPLRAAFARAQSQIDS